MADMVLSLGRMLLSTISTAMELWENRSQNVELLEELKHFMEDLQLNILNLQKKCIGALCSNSSAVALGALRMDLESANVEANTIVNEGFIRSLWDANKTLAQLRRLRKRVMTSFQTKLTIVTLDVMIETKQGLDSFKESMLKVNDQLVELYSTNSGSVRRIENMLREELQKVLQPVMVALEKSNGGFEAAVSMIHNTAPQTSETEKFFADVLEGLKHVTEHSNSTKIDETHGISQLQWYQDPVTWETMCDPVKGTDGHTYDRWTFLRHASSMTRSPLLGDIQIPFHIAVDDVSVRSRLFHEFPEQEERCRVERAAYKDEALQAAHLERLGEALIMLNNVLTWNPHDKECRSKRDYIQQQIVSETSQQATSSRSCASVNHQGGLREQWSDVLEVDDLNPLINGLELDPSMPLKCSDAFEVEDVNGKLEYFTETSQQATSSRSCAPENQQGVVREQWSDVSKVEDLNYVSEPEPLMCLKWSDVFEVEDLNGKLEEPNELDQCADVVLSADKLTATYLIHDSANAPKHVLLHANLPCPSNCYPFYYFEVIVEPPVGSKDDAPKRADVAIGFSCTKVMSQSNHEEQLPKKLGMYPGSCGYYSLNGEIFYYDTEKRQVVSIESEAFQAGDTVGAGFHSRTGNVFFTRCGQVVAFVKAAVFEHPVCTIFPSVGLQSYGAVTLNFGHSPYEFLNEPYPTRLDSSTCDENHLILSPNGLSLKTKANKDSFRAILADKPVPVRTTLFYFEVFIKDFPFFSVGGGTVIGFTGTDGFQQVGFPGDWKNSCGHYTDWEESFILVSQGTRLKSKRVTSWDGAGINDRIGAGIHSVLAVRNSYTMEVKFGSCVSTCLEVRKLSGFKSRSRLQKDILRFKNKKSNSGIEAFQADNVAPFHQEEFYFELTVNDSGRYDNITVGFCHHRHFRDDMQPGGYPYSCGYHGATGKLFTGSETGQEFGSTFSMGDTVGAGISFNTNMVFFVKNGKLIESIPNEMKSCALYPVVSLGSVGEVVHFNFGKKPFLFKSACQVPI